MLSKWKKAVNTKNALVLFFCIKPDSETIYSTENDTLYESCDTIEEVILSLQNSSKKLFQWLVDNLMKGNAEKCHLIMSTNESGDFQLGSSLIQRSD